MEEAKKASINELFKTLSVSEKGLSVSEAEGRLQQYGYNEIAEKRINPLLKLLTYFWGPIPWMIEVAAVLTAILGHWADLIIIMVLLIFNAVVGFWQEHQAANAVEALKKQLALKARVKRDGQWSEVDAAILVPGDIVRLRLGDIIPADVRLAEGDYLSVDQSALTGESLPVDKKPGDEAYSGSIAKQGEMVALVAATGSDTYFGKTARLVSTAKSVSHFQRAVLTIGDYLIYLSLGLVAVLILVQLGRGDQVLDLIQFALILTVASIPVAMPAVLSVTMAVGALAMSKMKAVVSRLESIEEMAGIDVLCSDKTGTLTKSELTPGETFTMEGFKPEDVILFGALASRAEDQDPIDLAVLSGIKDKKLLESYQVAHFQPFDPVHKRTEATVKGSDGHIFKVSKGAPQVILALDPNSKQIESKVNESVNGFASRGFRSLGVARTNGKDTWQFIGVIPLFDPLREDSKDTVDTARNMGLAVKMVTGDHFDR